MVVLRKIGGMNSKYVLKGDPKRLNLLGKRWVSRTTSRFLPRNYESCRWNRSKANDQTFVVACVEFEMSIRHTKKDVEKRLYRSLEFKRKTQKEIFISIERVFEARELDTVKLD